MRAERLNGSSEVVPISLLWELSRVCFFVGLFVDFRRVSGGQSIVDGERGSLRKRVVLLWACSASTLLVRLPVHDTLYEHFRL